MDTKVKELISESMSKIHEMADANTVMGTPVKVDNVTIIPVSKVSYGFAGGGSDIPNKSDKECFGGGTGGGLTLQPLGFLVVADGDVRFIQVNQDTSSASGIVNMIPEVLNKVQSMLKKDKKKEEKAVEVKAEKEVYVPTGREDTLDAVDDMKTEL